MKLSKQMKVLSCVTGIRIKIGATQLALAQYLGVSKSTISMVENNKRRLPETALNRITRLEIEFFAHQQQQKGTAFTLPAYQESPLEIVIRQQQEKLNRSILVELQSKLRLMTIRYRELLEQVDHLEQVLAFATKQESGFSLSSLEEAKPMLLKKLKRCDRLAQAKLEGKIAMMEIIVAAAQPAEDKEDVSEQIQQIAGKPALPQAPVISINDIHLQIPAKACDTGNRYFFKNYKKHEDPHQVNTILQALTDDQKCKAGQTLFTAMPLPALHFERLNSIPLPYVNYS
jgi:transcriptional regulator with XRE-family HTH domain